MTRKLEHADTLARLAHTPGWGLRDGKLHRSFRFPDFASAFGFMAASAVVAERMNHHPEWFNVYDRVEVDLVTHDVGGISELDFALAQKMNALALAAAGPAS